MWRKITVKQLFYFTIISTVIYVGFFRPILLRNEFKERIENVQCRDVWDFMADFSNMKMLNPELKHFEILDEEHDRVNGDWKYGVFYTEYFEHLPRFMENSAIGHYQVTKSDQNFVIKSEHVTCMIPIVNWYCLQTFAQQDFMTSNEDCFVQEDIRYQCPLFLVPLCRAELNSQRRKVLGNLQDQTFESL